MTSHIPIKSGEELLRDYDQLTAELRRAIRTMRDLQTKWQACRDSLRRRADSAASGWDVSVNLNETVPGSSVDTV